MQLQGMKRDEILGLLAALVPGPVWASTTYPKAPGEFGGYHQSPFHMRGDENKEQITDLSSSVVQHGST